MSISLTTLKKKKKGMLFDMFLKFQLVFGLCLLVESLRMLCVIYENPPELCTDRFVPLFLKNFTRQRFPFAS